MPLGAVVIIAAFATAYESSREVRLPTAYNSQPSVIPHLPCLAAFQRLGAVLLNLCS